MNITCEHCDSEIDIALDPRCVVYDPSGSNRGTYSGIKRGWRA